MLFFPNFFQRGKPGPDLMSAAVERGIGALFTCKGCATPGMKYVIIEYPIKYTR